MSQYNDFELVAMAHEHNEDAINVLYEKYRPLIVSKSKEVYKHLTNKGVELSDIVQEAMIGFEEAIRDFNQDDKTIFYTFASICVDRQLKTAFLKFTRDKHKILNEAMSFDGVDSSGESFDVLNFVSDVNDNPEYEMVSEETEREFFKEIKEHFTNFELEVFNLRIKGYGNSDIAIKLNKDSKSIDNTIQRIKSKLKKIHDNYF